ncbi:odorant receptor 10-like [Andrena cerasifolii]|uniref:odorant receptor 10-like n=1 Tax=Andrena cerasifolii TaxID=2819439 RepID=UPI004037872C
MNESYQNDAKNALKYTRFFLRLVGMWPRVNGHRSGRFERIASVVSIAICTSCLAFILLPCGYYCFFYVTDIHVKIKKFGPLVACAVNAVKYYYINRRGLSFQRCIRHIERDWRIIEDPQHRDIMVRNTGVAHLVSIVCATLFYTSVLTYHTILPSWSNVFKGNDTHGLLTYSGFELFADIQASPTYEIIYAVQCTYICVLSSVSSASCSLIALLTTHARAQMQVQIAKLQGLVEAERNNDRRQKGLLGAIVDGHVENIKFSRNISTALQEICFMEVVATTLMICALEYLSILEWRNRDIVAMGTYLALTLSFTFNIFIICYAGEFLVEEGSKLGDASYQIEWYDLPGKKGLDLIMLIAVSKSPPKLTGGKIFEISVNTFSNVLKSSVVYANLCQAVTTW